MHIAMHGDDDNNIARPLEACFYTLNANAARSSNGDHELTDINGNLVDSVEFNSSAKCMPFMLLLRN